MNYLLGMLTRSSFIRPRQHHSMALWTREGWVWKEKHDILEPEVPSEVDLALLGWTCRRRWGRWVWWTGFYHPSLCQETTGGSPVMRPQKSWGYGSPDIWWRSITAVFTGGGDLQAVTPGTSASRWQHSLHQAGPGQPLRHQVEARKGDGRMLILKGLYNWVDWTKWPAYSKPRDLSTKNTLEFWGTLRENRFRVKFCYHPKREAKPELIGTEFEWWVPVWEAQFFSTPLI